MTAATLCLTATPHPVWRALAAGFAVAMGWAAGRAVLLGRGPRAVRRFEWSADGTWHLARPDGTVEPAILANATATLGPWILLVWAVGSPGWRSIRRRYALIDVLEVGAGAFRELKGRLALTAGRGRGAGRQAIARPGAVRPGWPHDN